MKNSSPKVEKALEYKDVSLTYPNGFQALHNISFYIEKGKFVSIIGSSGAGKTTLIKTINKVNKISSGQIIVNHQRVDKLKGKKLRNFRREVGLIFQGYNLVLSQSSVRNVLMSLAPSLPFYRRYIPWFFNTEKMFALSCLDQLGLLDKAFVRTQNLSGGQKQRVALARTIAQLPSIILADEPVAALDPIMAKEIMDSFLKLNKGSGFSIFANLHHVDLAIKYSDIIIGMRKGKIVFNGEADKITLQDLKLIYGDKFKMDKTDIEKAKKIRKSLRDKYEKQ